MPSLLVATSDTLWMDRVNGAVICSEHHEPVKYADSWSWTRLTADEAAEWVGFIRSEYGPDRSPCEWCSSGVSK